MTEVEWGRSETLPGYTLLRGIDIDRSGALVSAIDGANGRRVLARVLSPALRGDARTMRRIRHDVGVLREVRHPNLVSVIGYDRGAGAVISEDVSGVTVRRILEQHGAVDPAAALVVADDCLAALEAVHAAGVVHGDIRPEAVVVDARGVARLRDAAVPVPALRRGWQPGTLATMPPEVWAGAPPGPAADLYALTCVFVELLTGRPAFGGSDIDALRRSHAGEFDATPLPPKVRPVVSRGLQPDPAQRPPSAAAYRADLELTATTQVGDGWRDQGRAWLQQEVARIPAAPPPAMTLPAADDVGLLLDDSEVVAVPWWRRPPRLAAALLAVLAVAVIVAVVAVAASRSGGGPALVPGPLASATPSSGESSQGPFTPRATASLNVLPSGGTPTVLATPPSVTPFTAQPTLGPTATPASGSTPTPTGTHPTPTPTCPVPPVCGGTV